MSTSPPASSPTAAAPPSGHDPARIAVVVIATVVGIAGLQAAATILLPVLIAGFIVIVVQPVVAAIISLGVPRGLATLVTILLLAVILSGLGTYLGDALTRFAVLLPEYQAPLSQRLDDLMGWLGARGVPVERLRLEGVLSASAVADSVRGLLGAVVTLVSNLLMVIIVTAFALLESTAMAQKVRAAFGEGTSDRLRVSVSTVQRYIGLKTVISMTTGLLAGLLCWALGVDFPVVWGFLAFVLNFIPNVGSIVAALPPALLSLVQVDVAQTLLLVLGYAAINVGIGSILEPRIMGRRLGLSPLVVFLSLVFWGWIWGPVGMLISVPLTVVAKLFLEQDAGTRWLAVLLGPGNEIPVDPEAPTRVIQPTSALTQPGD